MRGCPFPQPRRCMRRSCNSGCLDGFAMYEGVIESVSDDFHAFVFVTALSQTSSCFLPAKILLGAAEGDVIEIGYAGIL